MTQHDVCACMWAGWRWPLAPHDFIVGSVEGSRVDGGRPTETRHYRRHPERVLKRKTGLKLECLAWVPWVWIIPRCLRVYLYAPLGACICSSAVLR